MERHIKHESPDSLDIQYNTPHVTSGRPGYYKNDLLTEIQPTLTLNDVSVDTFITSDNTGRTGTNVHNEVYSQNQHKNSHNQSYLFGNRKRFRELDDVILGMNNFPKVSLIVCLVSI